jgi:CHAT domain-containing protein
MARVKKMDSLRLLLPRKFFFLFLLGLMLSSCAGNQYLSQRQKEGDRLFLDRKYDQAIGAYRKAIQEAERAGDKREIAHLKSLLGWTYSEAMKLPEAERELKEAIQIAETNGSDPDLFYARLAVVDSKMMNEQEGIEAAEKALDLISKKWQSRAKALEREKVIDYAVAHHGLPPDVDMIRTVTMAESSLAVLFLLKGDHRKTVEAGERAVKHFSQLTSLMKLATQGDKLEFFRGMGIASAATSWAYKNLGNQPREEAFARIGRESFKKIGIEVQGDDFLSAYAESGGYLALARVTEGTFRPDPRFSAELNRADKLYFEGQYRQAIPAYRTAIERAKAQNQKEETSRALSQLGWLLAELGRYPEAIRLMRESISHEPQGDFTAVTCARLGAVEGRLGNYEKGLEHANQALDIIFKNREKMFAGKDREMMLDASMKNPGLPPDVILIKAVTSAEGAKTTIYYLKKDYKETIQQGEKAICHFRNVEKAMTLAPEREQISYFEGLGFVTLAVGDAYRNRGEVQKGREYLEKSRDYFKKARLPFGDVIAEGLIGYSYVNEGNYNRGAEIFKNTLQRTESGGIEELKWHIRSVFARSLLEEGRRLEETLKTLQGEEKVEILWPVQKERLQKNREKLTALNSLLGRETGKKFEGILASLGEAADKEAALDSLQRLVRFFKELSYENYLGAIENVESIRSILETDLNKRLFQADKELLYSDFIQLSTELYGPEKGFEALERAKARSLMDLLATRELAFKGGALWKAERTLRESFGEIQIKGKEEERKRKDPEGPPAAAELEREVEKYRDLQIRIRREEPELASMITASYLTYRDLKNTLPPEVTLLGYFLGESKILIWVIDAQKIAVKEAPVRRDELKRMIGDFREALIERNGEKERSLGRKLYSILIQPVKDDIHGQRVGILPYQVLHYLPFGALHSGDRYFIEEYSLFYAPSASVLRYALDKGKPKGKKLLAFGNPDLGSPVYDLPFAQKEVEGIAKLYPAANTYVRREASKETFLKETGAHDIVHLACHAEFSEIDPLYSSIRLAEGPRGSGRLETHEIFSLELHSYLVVLSACKTGLGLVTSGDEIIGMNRAFLYAGTPSILSSLWSISDRSTANLMEDFYKNLKTMAKDEALRKAQVGMIESARFSAPFFWAAFYLTGDWR